MSAAHAPRRSTKPMIPPTIVNFSTAGLGGIMGWVVVHPFNTLFVRMNLASASGGANVNPAFLSYLSSTVKEAGFMSLYAGLSAGLLRQTCYATSRFGLFEVFRDEMAKYRPTDIWSRLSTGTLLGLQNSLESINSILFVQNWSEMTTTVPIALHCFGNSDRGTHDLPHS